MFLLQAQQYLDLKTMRKQSTILEIKSLSLLILLFGSLPLLAVEAVFVDTKINLDLEIANTDSKRKRGLMFRDQLDQNQGMIFIWSDSDTRCMWMKNTSIPLSVAYLSKSGHILEIRDLKPFSEKSVCSKQKARMALEMKKGWFQNFQSFQNFQIFQTFGGLKILKRGRGFADQKSEVQTLGAGFGVRSCSNCFGYPGSQRVVFVIIFI